MIRLRHGVLAPTLFLMASSAMAEGVVDASQHSCAELAAKVQEAGELRISAKHRNLFGNENVSERNYVASNGSCAFGDEIPTIWKVYGAKGEICEDLHICLPRPPLGPE